MTDLICSYDALAHITEPGSGTALRNFSRRIEAAAAAGYTGIGFDLGDYRLLRAGGHTDTELSAVLRDHDMRHIELGTLDGWSRNGEAGALSRAEEGIFYHMFKTFGARVLIVCGDTDADAASARDKMPERFAALCDRAAGHGVTIGLAPRMARTGITDATDRLLEETMPSNAGLFLDLARHGPCIATARSLRERMAGHIVGVRLREPEPSATPRQIAGIRDRRVLPGNDGDATSVLIAAAGAAGFRGPFGIEVAATGDSASTLPVDARRSYQAGRARICRALASGG